MILMACPSMLLPDDSGRLWQLKDFSHASCEKILNHVCSECRAARKRKINEGTASVAFGAYSHGNHDGVIQKTCVYPNVTIYVNRFLKHHGAKGSWSSIQLGWNCHIGPHKDVHNHSGTLNWNITLGNFSGGRLWLEPATSTSEASEDQQVRLCDGTMATGAVVDTKGRVHAFGPKRRYGVEQWSGDRATITAYTTRGVGHLSCQERDLLWSFGFPVGRDVNPGQHAADEPHHTEHRQRPKKSVRVPREQVPCSPFSVFEGGWVGFDEVLQKRCLPEPSRNSWYTNPEDARLIFFNRTLDFERTRNFY